MIGELISKYRVLAELGRGSMGTVYKAQDTFLGRYAALKLIAEKYLEEREAVLRFEREGHAASALVHPNICTVFEMGRWRNRPFMAMELLEGTTLGERLLGGRIEPAEALCIALPVLSALEATHKTGIVHRDIKPGNLFLTRRGTVKVLDFGLAKIKPHHETQLAAPGEEAPTIATFVTMPGMMVGTLAYMAPEQFAGEPVDGRADLYSLGVVLHEMLTGQLPVRGAPVAGVPERLAPVIAKMLAIDRNERYGSAAEVREALAG